MISSTLSWRAGVCLDVWIAFRTAPPNLLSLYLRSAVSGWVLPACLFPSPFMLAARDVGSTELSPKQEGNPGLRYRTQETGKQTRWGCADTRGQLGIHIERPICSRPGHGVCVCVCVHTVNVCVCCECVFIVCVSVCVCVFILWKCVSTVDVFVFGVSVYETEGETLCVLGLWWVYADVKSMVTRIGSTLLIVDEKW